MFANPPLFRDKILHAQRCTWMMMKKKLCCCLGLRPLSCEQLPSSAIARYPI